jgi:hypothetical protein
VRAPEPQEEPVPVWHGPHHWLKVANLRGRRMRI